MSFKDESDSDGDVAVEQSSSGSRNDRLLFELSTLRTKYNDAVFQVRNMEQQLSTKTESLGFEQLLELLRETYKSDTHDKKLFEQLNSERKKVQKLLEALELNKQQLAETNKETSDLSAENIELVATIKDFEKTQEDLSDKFDAEVINYSELKVIKESLLASLQTKTKTIVDLEYTSELERKQVAKIEKEMELMKTEKLQLLNCIDVANKKADELQRDLDDERDKMAKLSMGSKKQIDGVSQSCQNTQKQLDEMHSKNVELSVKPKSLEIGENKRKRLDPVTACTPQKVPRSKNSPRTPSRMRSAKMQSRKNKSFEVEGLLDHKFLNSEWHFLVRWKGFNAFADSWEPESGLDCPMILQSYRASKMDGLL